jgi:hypothetical protein
MPRWSWSGAGKGAGTGAAAGGMIGGPKGAAIGAIGGGIIGGFSGGDREAADKQRQEAMVLAQQQQEINRRQSEEQRQQDLHTTMAFYGPALQSLEHLYGIPMSAWGRGAPGNSPPPTRAMDAPMASGMSPIRAIRGLKSMGLWDQLSGAAPIPPGSPVIPRMQQTGTLRPGFATTPFRQAGSPAPAPARPPSPPPPAFGPMRRY